MSRTLKRDKRSKRIKLGVDWSKVTKELTETLEGEPRTNAMAKIEGLSRGTSINMIEGICKSILCTVEDYNRSNNLTDLAKLKSKTEELSLHMHKLSEIIE